MLERKSQLSKKIKPEQYIEKIENWIVKREKRRRREEIEFKTFLAISLTADFCKIATQQSISNTFLSFHISTANYFSCLRNHINKKMGKIDLWVFVLPRWLAKVN
jgi:hypothetical protein